MAVSITYWDAGSKDAVHGAMVELSEEMDGLSPVLSERGDAGEPS